MDFRGAKVLTVLYVLVLLAGFSMPAHTAERPKRGDYPRCQQECLNQLQKDMDACFKDYRETGDRMLYEKRVEQGRLIFDNCIDTCRQRHPVK